MRVPPLAVGFGINLPMAATLPVTIGALVGWAYDRSTRTERARRTGVLVASGMIVGESLFGGLNAGLIVGYNKDAPLSVVGPDYALAGTAGQDGYNGLVILLYAWLIKRARATCPASTQ